MAERAYKYLRPEDILALSTWEFAPRALVEGYFAGRHRSVLRGSSTDFRDFRPYVPGDDPALVDWRVFARTDRHYLRTFDQETTLECHILLDSSASMGFGAPLTKLDYASFVVAALCYLVIHNTDRVSLQLFDDAIRTHFPPGSTHRHLHSLLHALEHNQPGRRTSISAALRKSFPLLKRRGTLVVVSDFLDDPAAIFDALGPYMHHGFRIHLLQILAPHELELPDRGLQAFVDMESGDRVVAHTAAIAGAYREAMQGHIRGLRELAIRRGIDHVMAGTDTHFFKLFDHLVR